MTGETMYCRKNAHGEAVLDLTHHLSHYHVGGRRGCDYHVYHENKRATVGITRIFAEATETATAGEMTPRLAMEFTEIRMFMGPEVLPILYKPV